MLFARLLKKLIVISALVMGSMFIGLPAQAGMVGTAEILDISSPAQEITAQRTWIQQQLEANGVNTEDAILRVASLSDQQVQQVHQRFEDMPAGAGALGTVAFIFVVLLITDYAGITDIFPFVRPASHSN